MVKTPAPSRLAGVLLASFFLTLAACGGDDPSGPDGGPKPTVPDASTSDGGADAGTTDDAGSSTDAGPVDDAGTIGDAGTTDDAGTTTDAGTTDDAGTTTDAGTTDDAGTTTDAGTARCGDGVEQEWEACDDANTVSGDGCSATCLQVEPGWLCETEGAPCVQVSVCGNGKVEGAEACDDGNTVGGDGCKATCIELEPGWTCPANGGPCNTTCGDGIRAGSESCDDGNKASGDGCAAACSTVEAGWSCPANGGPCGAARCGDGIRAGDEACDDGNSTSGDGCNATCSEVELGWNCASTGGRCHAKDCGDGIIAGDEECEDGNAAAGDGCGVTCRLEPGFKCPTVGQLCTAIRCGDGIPEGTEQCDDGDNDLGDGCTPLCVREPRCANGVCEPKCGDGVMLPNDTTEQCDDGNTRANDGCSPTCQLEEGFACSVIEDDPPSRIELPVVYRDFRGKDLPADDELPAGHVDFENASGTELGIVASTLGSDGKPVYAKEGVSSVTTHGKDAFDQWYRDVRLVNQTVVGTLPLTSAGTGTYVYREDNFFPLDGKGWVALEKEPTRSDANGVPHNFSFTSETRYWFEYKGTEVLNFRGDDDLWVFINGRLALDLGGVHSATEGTVTLSQRASQLGLSLGGIYEVAVFQAERRTSASSYRLSLTHFTTRRTECVALCGNGTLDLGEQCDDGVNDGGYGQCARGCVLGARCGDGVVQSEQGEDCDVGRANGQGACSLTCKLKIG